MMDEQNEQDLFEGEPTTPFDATVGDDSPSAPAIDEQLAAEQDRVLRLQAELQNVHKRQAREIGDVRRYGGLPLMRDILPVLDNIDRAIEAAASSQDTAGLLDGVKLVRQQLLTALAQHSCEPIEAEGATFDPNEHQAILQQPSADIPAGQVMAVTQTGYKLHDRVVRAAQVIVSSGPADTSGLAADQSDSSTQTA